MKQNGFYMVPNCLAIDDRCNIYDIGVFNILALHYNLKNKIAFPSLNTIKSKLKISKSKVSKTIDHLAELGYLVKEKRKDPANPLRNLSNIYHLTSCIYKKHTPTITQSTPSSQPTGGSRFGSGRL